MTRRSSTTSGSVSQRSSRGASSLQVRHRDLDKRFVLVDKQGLTGSKVEYHSIPYKSITHFSIETAGTFDLDAELKIWISGTPAPIQKQFNKKLSIYEVQAVLASYVLK